MKRFSLIAASFIFAAVFAVSAFGQGAAQPAAGFKLAVINTEAFDADQGGITRYVSASKALEAEFKPMQTEIEGLMARYQTIAKEVQTQQATAASGKVPVDQTALQRKITEAGELEIQIKRKQEDAKLKLQNREPVIRGPIRAEIGRALQDYAKQKGYALILDAAKLDGAGLILAFDEAKVDVTKDFITFFNARPAGTASAAAPR